VRRLALALGLLLALGALAVLAVERGWVAIQDPSLLRYPIRGLDVSRHQGAIDWARVGAEPHLRFVWIKASEGGDWTDPRFAENWRGARSVGLAVGAYHYFTLCTPGADQAAQFLRTVPVAPDALPPAIDLEHEGNCGNRPSTGSLLAEVQTFLDAVEQGLGKRPVVYTTREFHGRHLRGVLLDHPLWLRDVLREPGDIDGRPWTVWQHWSRGRVDGIEGFVDRNVFRGDEAAFAAFVGP
jgi:lysozyme